MKNADLFYGFNSICIVKGIRPKLTFMSTEQEYMSAICARGASPSKTFWQGILTACMTDHTHADSAIRGSQPRRISSDTNQFMMSRIVHIAARYFHWEMNFLSTWHTLMRMKISVNLMVSVDQSLPAVYMTVRDGNSKISHQCFKGSLFDPFYHDQL